MLVPTGTSLIGICMSVCLHRYFAHNAFSTSRPVRVLLAMLAAYAYQGGHLWWAGKHGKHHHHCDQPDDPHSAYQTGFWYAWVGWTVSPRSFRERDYDFVNPAFLTPEMHFLDKYYGVHMCAVFMALEHFFGRSFVVYNCFFPMLFCRVFTLLFNVAYHLPDSNGSKRCKSTDLPFMIVKLVGEGDHDIHHKVPTLSKRGDMDLACE